MNIPAEYQQFLTPVFLSLIVMALTGPFKGRVGDGWLPIIAIAVALVLNVGIALYLGLNILLMALNGILTAFVASGIYSHATTIMYEGQHLEGQRGLMKGLPVKNDQAGQG